MLIVPTAFEHGLLRITDKDCTLFFRVSRETKFIQLVTSQERIQGLFYCDILQSKDDTNGKPILVLVSILELTLDGIEQLFPHKDDADYAKHVHFIEKLVAPESAYFNVAHVNNEYHVTAPTVFSLHSTTSSVDATHHNFTTVTPATFFESIVPTHVAHIHGFFFPHEIPIYVAAVTLDACNGPTNVQGSRPIEPCRKKMGSDIGTSGTTREFILKKTARSEIYEIYELDGTTLISGGDQVHIAYIPTLELARYVYERMQGVVAVQMPFRFDACHQKWIPLS